MDPQKKKSAASRRDFIKKSSLLMATGAVGASALSVARGAHSFGSDTIKIGLVGCGGRGTRATMEALNTKGETKLVAMGDVFPDRLASSYRGIRGKHPKKVHVPEDQKFVGFDAYKRVLESDADLVIFATPPGFRPLHFEAAINAGKHVFMEKPVAVDAPGVQRVLASAKKAKEKGLAVAVGLQRRHEQAYEETIDRLKSGQIGEILFTRAYWNSGGVWVRDREEKHTELEYQMRNWYYFNWLCGDHIVEQHIHNLDVINWLMDDYPATGNGMGGREVRDDLKYGQIFDHHFIEFTYPNGVKMYSQCRHIPGAWRSVSEHAHGTKGSVDMQDGVGRIYDRKGNQVWKSPPAQRGHQEEHHDLFAKLRKGDLPNEAEYGAKSTMTAIMGRLCSYSGKIIQWDKAIASNVSLANVDALEDFNSDPPILPDSDGGYEVPVPGKAKVL